MDELAGRVAVITGAASGIGFGMAQAFAAADMHLVLADRDAAALSVAAAELRATGADVLEVPTDVRDAKAVEALAAATIEGYGSVHVVCNNAGVWTLGLQWETDLVDWQWVVDVNLWGVVHGIRTFVPLLLRNAEGGHVVNTASMGGLVGGALAGPYAATKHAVVGLSKSLRAELAMSGAGVGVSLVCPGKVRTSILDSVNVRPEADAEPELGPAARAALDAMRSADAEGICAQEAGLLVRDAVQEDRFWVFPGADAHLPLVRREAGEMLAAFDTDRTGLGWG